MAETFTIDLGFGQELTGIVCEPGTPRAWVPPLPTKAPVPRPLTDEERKMLRAKNGGDTIKPEALHELEAKFAGPTRRAVKKQKKQVENRWSS